MTHPQGGSTHHATDYATIHDLRTGRALDLDECAASALRVPRRHRKPPHDWAVVALVAVLVVAVVVVTAVVL